MDQIAKGCEFPATPEEAAHFLKHNHDIKVSETGEKFEDFFQRVIIEKRYGQRKTVNK
jgi:hypothetical protein